MKGFFKKTLSMVLCFVMVFTMFQGSMLSASAKVVGPDNKTELTITADKSKYSWGDMITFAITIDNSSQETIDYATLSVFPQFSKFFSLENDENTLTVTNIAPGESKSLEISFKSHCSLLSLIFMPLIKLFNIGVSNVYRSTEHDKIQRVSLGITSFKFGFSINCGFDTTATGKELEKIKKLNNNQLPDIYMDSEDSIPSFIDGQFSEKTVKNAADALASLNSIENLMGFEDVNDELSFYQKDSYAENTFYRFQQYYNGIEVYGKNLIVAVDANKKTTALSNDYEPNIDIATLPKILEEDAVNIVNNYIQNASNIISQGLCIYSIDIDPVLTYKIQCNGIIDDSPFSGFVFVDATLGYVVTEINNIYFANVQTSAKFEDRSYSFNVWQENGKYQLFDSSRNIVVYNLNRNVADRSVLTSPVVNSTMSDENNNHYLAISRTNLSGFTDETEISIYHNLTTAYDYFYNNYGRNSYNGKGSPILLSTYAQFRSADGSIYGRNAYSYSGYVDHTDIVYGADYDPFALDVVVHEYTHSVEGSISDMRYHGESGALMEAYSDIMGEIVENDTSWMHYTNRNLANPSATSQPSTYKGTHWASLSGRDNGGVHTNGTVIAHAAYLMQKDKITDMDRLGELWYRSLYYLDRNSSFEDCRAAVIASARDMGMSAEEITCIQSAFDKVGVKGTALGHFGFSSISGKVLDASSLNPVPGAEVVAVKTAPNSLGAGIVETNANGEFEITGLSSGTYEVSVNAKGYRPEIKYSIKVNAFSHISLSNSFLLSASVIEKGAIGGKITNAIDGSAVSNATIRFRNNHGNKTGNYIKENGSILQLATDSSGKYSYDSLETGYYTMEVSKEGFITSYFDVFAAPSNNICQNQNYSISPVLPEGQYRIVLTWGKDPRDLDSHITGVTTNGSSFHVYYNNKNAWDGDVHVANLDVDDTSSYGPETITLIPTTANTYRYYVYRYAGSGAISTSDAHIEVYKGNVRVGVYDAPTNQGTGDYWTVFEITNGTIKTINRIGSSVYKSGVEAQSADNEYMPPKD